MSGVEILRNHMSALITTRVLSVRISGLPDVFYGHTKVPGSLHLTPWFLREVVILKVPRVVHSYIRVLGCTRGLYALDIG